MATSSSLPISNLVNVAVNLSAVPAQIQNLQSLCVLGSSDVISNTEKMRTYTTVTQVATDFGTSAPEYLAALEWFSQSPQPQDLKIAQWNKTAVAGRLGGALVSSANQLISRWTAITNGGFKIGVDGGSLTNITGLNFSAATNLNGVASIITTGLTGATCTWNNSSQSFGIKSNTTGATSNISFLNVPASGTDISALLGMSSTSSGAFVTVGSDPVSAIDTVTDLDDSFGQTFYALFVCGASNSDHLAIAAFVEASNAKHAYAVNTQEGGVLTSTDTTNIAYQLKQLGYKKTATQYSSSNLYAVVSLFARILTTNYNANKTVITLMYKQEPGVVAETLSQTQMNALLVNNCNVFVAYNNNTYIIQAGQVASGDFIDTIFGADWLALTIQNTVYNTLYTSTTKVPQTNDGHNIIKTVIVSVLDQAVNNGLLAAGQWNGSPVGTVNTGDFLSKGYYVYVADVNTQNLADRAVRKSMPFQILAKLSGAIHTASVIINIDR